MIISWFSDRRTAALGMIAQEFALELAATCPQDSVALYVDRAVPRPAGAQRARMQPRVLPANLRSMLNALNPSQHAVLALVAPLTADVITAFDLSIRVFVLADQQVKSLRTVQRVFKVCRELGYSKHQLRAVLSTEPVERDPVDREGVVAALKSEVVFGLPQRQLEPVAWQKAMNQLATSVVRRI